MAPLSEAEQSVSSTTTVLTTVEGHSLYGRECSGEHAVKEGGRRSQFLSHHDASERPKGDEKTHVPWQAITPHEAVKAPDSRSRTELQTDSPLSDEGQASKEGRLSCFR